MKPRFNGREIRLFCYLAVVLAVVAWRFLPRPWHPQQVVETAHFRIYSNDTLPQTQNTARVLEFLYTAYSNRLGAIPGFQTEPAALQVKLFKDRKQMRWVNPGLGWAEAFYQAPYCRAYFSDGEVNPYHWMLHEATHQLNHEVAHLKLAKWLEEGLAEYFSTSQIRSGGLAAGQIDPSTYPVWWLDDLATSTNLAVNLTNGSVIPLRAILTGRGGPRMDDQVNLYYLHWWTLTYFVFESPNHRDRALSLAQRGGDLPAFEELIGPVDQVQIEWHAYVQRMKAALAGKDRDFLRLKKIPRPFDALTSPSPDNPSGTCPRHAGRC